MPRDLSSDPVVDLSEDQLRARGAAKWAAAAPGVLAAWVAEMDFGLSAVLAAALHDAIGRGAVGYAGPDSDALVGDALAGFARRRWQWDLDPARVVLTTDTMTGVLLVLQTLCEDAPVVVPTPTYPPFLGVVPLAGRELLPVPLAPDAERAVLDLDGIEAALRAGARTVLLCQPHNPWGRVFGSDELTGLRDVVERYGARVISDEVHAPLVLHGSAHVPYLAVDGTAEHATTVIAAAKGWNVPGLKSAQIIPGTEADAAALRALPLVANHGSSPLGVVAARSAFSDGEPWLDAVLERLAANRDRFAELVAARLPAARLRQMEATYLAWLDLSGYGEPDPAAVALERGRLLVNDGRAFGPGGEGHVRVNLATSPERVERIVDALEQAFER